MNTETQTLATDRQVTPQKDFVEAFVREHDIKVIKMGGVDIDGLWRGKRLSADYFVKAAHEAGSNICNILFGWDMHDESIPLVTYTGFNTGYPDINLRPDLSTLRLSPDEPGAAMVIADFYDQDGNLLPLAPRTILRNMVDRARGLGYDPIAAYEYEFFLFEGNPRENARRGWRDLEPFTVGSHTYSVYRDTGSEFMLGTIRRRLAEQGIFIEASNSEHGPGQFEVNIHYGDALKAADDALILKHTVKEVAAEHGYTATFMAKINSQQSGSSGHVHQSLNRTADGEAAFANLENPSDLSDLGQSYLAGLVSSSKELAALFLPTINSYKRLKGEAWASSSATWGYDNRTVAIRSIPSAGRAARVENRTPGADANPYLVIAAGLAAGLNGIEQGLTPPDPVIGNAYALEHTDDISIPATLGEAVEAFENSEVAKRFFGEDFVRHYVQTRRWEIENHEAAVTDWEINRYIEHV